MHLTSDTNLRTKVLVSYMDGNLLSVLCQGKGFKSDTVLIEVQWAGVRDSPMTRTASDVLTGPAGARLELMTLSGARRGSMLVDGKQVGFSRTGKPGNS